MLQFLELRIDSNKKCLIIDTEVENSSIFKNVTIDSIYIDTQDTWIINGPSTKAKCVYSPEYKDLDIIQDVDHKRVRVTVDSNVIPIISNNLYFVYVLADISQAPEIISLSCSETLDKISGTVVDTHYLYDSLLSSIRVFRDKCTDTSEFVDRFLKLQVVESAIRTSDYHIAIDYWKKFFMDNPIKQPFKSCKCNERVR